MRTLAIDTSTAACSVALFDEGRLIDSAHHLIGRGHAEQLMVMIAALDQGGRADRIWVGCGPGSFTGVRVGIAAALGLGIGWQVPVAGFGSLALVAAAYRGEPVLVAMEGGHGQFFVQSFGADGAADADPESMLPSDAARAATHHVVGSRAAVLVELRRAGVASDAYPDARHALAVNADQSGWPPRPVYGRAPDAVAKLP